MKTTKAQQTRLMNGAKAVLHARRSGNVKREQQAYDKLNALCQSLNLVDSDGWRVGASEVVAQAIAYLKRTGDIAAHMNGLV